MSIPWRFSFLGLPTPLLGARKSFHTPNGKVREAPPRTLGGFRIFLIDFFGHLLLKRDIENELLDLDGYISCGRRSRSGNDRCNYLLRSQKIVKELIFNQTRFGVFLS